ncbi:hypothetical protein BDW75DRAFT_175967 [Aspergillus navahoensis]
MPSGLHGRRTTIVLVVSTCLPGFILETPGSRISDLGLDNQFSAQSACNASVSRTRESARFWAAVGAISKPTTELVSSDGGVSSVVERFLSRPRMLSTQSERTFHEPELGILWVSDFSGRFVPVLSILCAELESACSCS